MTDRAPAVRPAAPTLAMVLAAVVTLVAAVVAGCAGGPTGLPALAPFTAPATPAAPAGPRVAFRATTAIGIVDGTAVRASAPGNFDASDEPLVTEDHRFVFARTGDGNLVTLDARDGSSRVVPVPRAGRLGTAPGSVVLWWEAPDRLVELDLSAPNPTPRVRRLVALPPTPAAANANTELVAARAGTAIIGRDESPRIGPSGPDALYAVRAADAPAALGRVDPNSAISGAVLGPDGAALAFAQYRDTGNGCGTGTLAFSGADGKQQTYDVAARAAGTGSTIEHLWWERGQPLGLSLGTWRCDPPGPVSVRVWSLEGDALRQAAPPTVAVQALPLAPGQRAVILPATPAAGTGDTPEVAGGTLAIEDSGRRITVQPDVDAMALLPAQ